MKSAWNSTATSKSPAATRSRSEEHTSELQSQSNFVCRLLLENDRANRPTEVWPQTLPDRVLALPDPVRQRFIDHDHLALLRDVGPFVTPASDDRHAHPLVTIA